MVNLNCVNMYVHDTQRYNKYSLVIVTAALSWVLNI